MTFDVWAPIPRDVKLNLADDVIAMTRSADGWWSAPDEVVWIDAPYGFLLDDDPVPLPDPRSRWQPNGVHDRSHTFDPTAFAWTDAAWPGRPLQGGVIYELHIGTFTPDGTLDTAVERLPHLVDLGVDFVELLPVNSFNGSHNWGYDGVLWYSVDDTYGGPRAYQRFVDACHHHGLAVIQDVVYNHLGPSGNYLPRFGPYMRDDSNSAWGPSINLASDHVRRYILDNAAMWMRDYHVDGLRLDAVHALVDPSPVHILRELADETAVLSAEVGRPLTLIAESDLNDPTMITPAAEGGYGIDAQWSDDFHHAVHVALTGETSGYYADFAGLDSLAKVITNGFFHDGTYSSFRGRVHGAPIDTDHLPAWRLVVASQTHDQIGNRAIGDRLTASLDEGQLAIAAVLTLLSAFTPMLFMGEEWGASTPWQFFTGHPEPELGRATAEGRLAEFERMGWDRTVVPDPQAVSTFADSKLDWTELSLPAATRVLELYRSLIHYRRTHPSLAAGVLADLSVERDEAGRWFVIRRRNGPTTVVNFSTDPITVPCSGRLAISTDPSNTVDTHVHLVPHSAVIIERSP